jgi:phage antirepressor YoqD-like protein
MKHENNLRVGERDVFKWLVENKYIFRSKDDNCYYPYAKYEANNKNYFTITLDNINGKTIKALKITGVGVVALTAKVVEHFKM